MKTRNRCFGMTSWTALLFLALLCCSQITAQKAEREASKPTITKDIEHKIDNDIVLIYHCWSIGKCMACNKIEQQFASYCADSGRKEPLMCSEEIRRSDGKPWDPSQKLPNKPDPPPWGSCSDLGATEGLRFLWFEIVNLAFLGASGYIVYKRQIAKSIEKTRRIARSLASA
ncbi:hypothetical protein BJ742DRAFT_142568 [Cladochytrium replicatum]|nr:hypothetical protein BJ742DRAFT_142568 [Cladochytrium replicatum]